ncbi:MFS transporter, partial [Actinophytocola sp.]|uniref:MFS transporter n=1 Tax=Actinophytocola sp. TaxID=1872138 RepID=UPI002D80CDF7
MRSFWLLTGATAISNAGNTFLYLAVPWALVSTTGSSLLAVLSLAAQTLPFLAAPFLGAVIDRHDRRFLFAAAEITQGCCVALIPLLLAMNAIGAVFAVLFVTGLAKVITEVVGSYALIPALVPKERLDRACGAFNSIQLVARFAGPALAGLTIAAVGPGWALAIDAATFLCTSLTALVLPRLRAGGRRQPLGAMLREGARFFRERPNLRRLTLALALYNLGAGGLEPTLLSLGANHWNWSATALGVLVSAGAVAAAAGAWLSRAVPGRHRRITLWFGVMAAGSLGLLFGAPVAVTIGFCVLSLGEGGVNAATMAYRQHEIPTDLAGRVNTVIRMFVTGAIPASALLLGLTANLVSSGWLFLPVALPALLGLAVWTSRRKEGAVKNVLLVNSNSRAPARMLQDRKDIRLSVISMPGHLDHYDEGTDVEVVDSIQDLTQVRLAALRIRRRNPFDHVVAPAEWSLQAGGYLRSLFGLPGPDYAVVNAFSNKLVMKQRLRAAGLPVARFLLVDQFTDAIAAGAELGWPVFLKRTHGGGATDMFVLTDAAEVTALAADERTARLRVSPYPMLAEELLDIEAEFHCDGVVAGGAVRF